MDVVVAADVVVGLEMRVVTLVGRGVFFDDDDTGNSDGEVVGDLEAGPDLIDEGDEALAEGLTQAVLPPPDALACLPSRSFGFSLPMDHDNVHPKVNRTAEKSECALI